MSYWRFRIKDWTCRLFGHDWRPHDAWWDETINARCFRCGTLSSASNTTREPTDA